MVDISAFKALGIVLAGISIALAGIMMAGSIIFGERIGEEAKGRIMTAIAGLVVLSVGSAMITAFS